MKKYYISGLLAMCATQLFNTTHACVVTLFNDSKRTIQILDHNDVTNKHARNAPSSLPIIPRGKSRRIGKPDEHAHFTVFLQHPRYNTFIATYEVQQDECNKTGNPYLKLSDIKNRTGETSLFTIKDISKHHTSMVRQLPSIKKADIYKQEAGAGCLQCQQ